MTWGATVCLPIRHSFGVPGLSSAHNTLALPFRQWGYYKTKIKVNQDSGEIQSYASQSPGCFMTYIVLFQGINVKSRLTVVWYITLTHVQEVPSTHARGGRVMVSRFPSAFIYNYPGNRQCLFPVKLFSVRSPAAGTGRIILHSADHSGSCEACIFKGSTFKDHVPYSCALSLFITQQLYQIAVTYHPFPQVRKARLRDANYK